MQDSYFLISSVFGYSAAQANHLQTIASSGCNVQPLSGPSTQRPVKSKREPLDTSQKSALSFGFASDSTFLISLESTRSPSTPSCVAGLRFSAMSLNAVA